MGIRRALLAVVATAIGLALLLSFKPHDLAATAQPPAAVATPPSTEPEPESEPESEPGPSTTAPAPAKHHTVTGDVVDTRWGPVQVAIKVANARISDVQVLRSPDGNRRDIEINQAALPILTQETLSAQSAEIDMVSGATYTSDGYIRSLQSAIDRAGL